MSIVARILFWGFWVIVMTVTWSHVLVNEAKGWFSSCYNCFGDWAAHLTYTTSLAYGQKWPLELPVFSGHQFSYPFFIDLLSAWLVKLGVDLRLAMIIPGWILSMLLVWLLVKLGEKISGKKLVGYLVPFLFLFNWGGEYLNIIVSRLVPQRGWLLGMPFSIIVYLLLWKWQETKNRKLLLLAGVITGCLPLIHFHSMLAVLFIAGGLMILNFSWKWVYFFLPAILLAAGQVSLFYSQSLGLSMIRFKLGWLAGEQNWLIFWVINLGMILLLGIYGFIKAKKKTKQWFGIFGSLFILGNLLIFQPFDWDNTKIFDHWYLMLAVLGGIGAERLLKHRRLWVKIGGGILITLAVLPGFLEVIKFNQYQKNKYLFFSRQQLEMAEEIKQVIEPKALVLTASNHNHWLPCLTGRKIVLGYDGWLWSYGINYSRQRSEVQLMYAGGEESKNLLTSYKIDYVLIGPDEEREYGANSDFFENNFPVVFNQGDEVIYQVR